MADRECRRAQETTESYILQNMRRNDDLEERIRKYDEQIAKWHKEDRAELWKMKVGVLVLIVGVALTLVSFVGMFMHEREQDRALEKVHTAEKK